MSKINLFLFVLSFPVLVFGQAKISCKDYVISQTLRKAFDNIENNNIKKGKEFLTQAQNCRNIKNFQSDYLFSNFIEALIFNKQKKYNKALGILNSMEDGYLHKSKDSLVVETLYLKFGKEKVLNSFRKITEIKTDPGNVNKHSVYLSDLDFTFKFNSREGGWRKYDENGNVVPIYKPKEVINEKLDSVAKFTSFYMILKE